MVKLLLFLGADVNAKSKSFSGRTALQAAAASGHINVVKLLLDNAADVNVAGPIGTALHAAAEAGYIDLVKMLLDNGADIDAGPTNNCCTALRAAARGGYLDVVETLLNPARMWKPLYHPYTRVRRHYKQQSKAGTWTC